MPGYAWPPCLQTSSPAWVNQQDGQAMTDITVTKGIQWTVKLMATSQYQNSTRLKKLEHASSNVLELSTALTNDACEKTAYSSRCQETWGPNWSLPIAKKSLAALSRKMYTGLSIESGAGRLLHTTTEMQQLCKFALWNNQMIERHRLWLMLLVLIWTLASRTEHHWDFDSSMQLGDSITWSKGIGSHRCCWC